MTCSIAPRRFAAACLVLVSLPAAAQMQANHSMFSPPLNAGNRQSCTIMNSSAQTVTISSFRIVRADGGVLSEPAVTSTCGNGTVLLAPGASCTRTIDNFIGWGGWLGNGYCRLRHNGTETAIAGSFMTDGKYDSAPWAFGTVPLQRVTIAVAP